MSEEKLKATFDKAKGSVKEGFGKVTNKKKMESIGILRVNKVKKLNLEKI